MNDGMSFRAVVSLSVETLVEHMGHALWCRATSVPRRLRFSYWRNYEWKMVKLLL